MLVIQDMVEFPHSKDYSVAGEAQDKSTKGCMASEWYGCPVIRLSHKGSCLKAVGKGFGESKLSS